MIIKNLIVIFAIAFVILHGEENKCAGIEDKYNKARCFFQNDQKEDALLVMSKAVEKDPQSFKKAEFYLRLLYLLKDKSGLHEYLPHFTEHFLNSPEMVILCAECYSMIEKYKQAEQLLETQYEKRPNLNYLKKLAEIFAKQKKYDEALSVTHKIFSSDSTYAKGYYIIGKRYLDSGFMFRIKKGLSSEEILENALKNFETAIKYNPTNYVFYLKAGETCEKMGDWEKAYDYYAKAVSYNSLDFRLIYDLGKKAFINNMYKQALMYFEMAYELDKNNVDLLIDIENTHKKLGSFYDYYITSLERFSYAMPETLSIKYNLAIEYAKRGRDKDALELFKEIKQKDPDYEETNAGIAALYLANDNCVKAIPYLKEHLKFKSSDYLSWYNLAVCMTRISDTVKAIENYEKVAKLKPTHSASAYFLGTYFYNNKEYKKVLSYLLPGLDYKNKIGVYRMLGGSYYHSGNDYDKALKYLKKCLSTKEDDEILHYMIAKIYEKKGMYQEAADEYQKCMSLSKDPKNNRYYETQIQRLRKM